MNSTEVTFFGLALTTHRDKHLGPDATSYFQYESAIAAIAILFFRTTVHQKKEPVLLRSFFALLLTSLAYCKRSYELILAVEIFSYAVAWFVQSRPKTVQSDQRKQLLIQLIAISASAAASLSLSHLLVSGTLRKLLGLLTPSFVVNILNTLFPIEEMKAAYSTMADFLDPLVLSKHVNHLLFVTFHLQVGMGYLGIDFLRTEQHRRNLLIRMDAAATEEEKAAVNGAEHKVATEVKLERSRKFQRGAAPFILFTALPYMLQIITYGNINKFAFTCLQHDMHRTIRLNELFDHDNHLMAMANESPTSPEAYAESMNQVVSTVYDIWNRKLFSLPKVLLLPGVMSRQPMLVAQVFPFIFMSDWLKANAVSYMTTKIEQLRKETQELKAVRSKVESFDIKNAELLQRSGKGATRFTQRRWEELTVQVQSRVVVSDLITRSKGFFSFIQRNFVFGVLIDCALANLIAIGKIVTAEIFVFSRAIEDAVDMVLMRSRGEAELARMMTEIAKLKTLSDIWERSKSRAALSCNLAPPDEKILVLRNLHYTRGTASARADHVELVPGVYALTGSNGSGKSTLFRILMGCNTNDKSIDLPSSINLLTPMAPLIEKDDLIREVVCEPADENCDAETLDERKLQETMEISATGEIVSGSTKIPPTLDTSLHVPKLSITMPSSNVVEISQTFYWPLYSKPIDWIYQEHVLESCEPSEVEVRARRVAEELNSLEFFQPIKTTVPDDEQETVAQTNQTVAEVEEATVRRIMQELQEEKDDWFGDLSGGQKSKVELVRKVFLQDRCPDVLLVDETMAPLDPASKALVMTKLKKFCKESIIIVIYHTDVGRGKEGTGDELIECIPANDFFDKNVHLDKGIVHVRDTC